MIPTSSLLFLLLRSELQLPLIRSHTGAGVAPRTGISMDQ